MKILLLEDDMNRVEQFQKRIREIQEKFVHENRNFELIHFEDAESCINELKKGTKFHLILLDHDLGGKVYVSIDDKNTGSEVARWLSSNYNFHNEDFDTAVITHTLNIPGAENIKSLIPGTIHVPFIWQERVFHDTIKIK